MEWFQKVWENNIADVSKCEKHFLQEDFPEKAPLFLGIAQIIPPHTFSQQENVVFWHCLKLSENDNNDSTNCL